MSGLTLENRANADVLNY